MKKLVFALPTLSSRVENTVLKTLESLFKNMDSVDRKACSVFLLEANINPSVRVKELKNRFAKEIKDGLLIIERTTETDYPVLPGHKGNKYSHRMMKQNIDFSILLQRIKNMGEYIVLLEDDVLTTPKFAKYILNDISYFSYYDWVLIKACSLGAIGNIYKKRDLPVLIQYLKDNYKFRPVDVLQTEFVEKECGKGRYEFHPARSLFKPIGIASSHSAIENANYEIGPSNFEHFYIHDLGVGALGFIIRPLSHTYYWLRKQFVDG